MELIAEAEVAAGQAATTVDKMGILPASVRKENLVADAHAAQAGVIILMSARPSHRKTAEGWWRRASPSLSIRCPMPQAAVNLSQCPHQ